MPKKNKIVIDKKTNIVIDKLTGKKIKSATIVVFHNFSINKYLPQKCGKLVYCHFEDKGIKIFSGKRKDKMMLVRSISQLKRY